MWLPPLLLPPSPTPRQHTHTPVPILRYSKPYQHVWVEAGFIVRAVNFSDVSLYSTNLIFKIVFLFTWCLLICCLVSYKVVFAEASSWLLSRQTAKNATKNTKLYLTSHRSKLLLASVVRGLSAMLIFIGHTTKKCPIKNCVSLTCSTFCVNMAAPVV